MARPPAIEPGFKVLSQDKLADEDDPHGSYWGTGRVFVKPDQVDKPRAVGYEFLASRLAAAIGLPTPAGETGLDRGTRKAWVSAVIDYQGEEFAPEDPRKAVLRLPEIAAGIFVFDVWVLNSDRNEGNVVSHPKLGMWMIDHDYAFGALHADSPVTLQRCRGQRLKYHIFENEQLDDKLLRDWGERVQSLPGSVIKKTVLEGYRRGLYTAPERNALITFLLHRQAEVHRLVRESRPSHGQGRPRMPVWSVVQIGQDAEQARQKDETGGGRDQ